MIEVWYGTPNEMAKAAAKPTQPQAVKWARDYLATLKVQALIYDNAAVADIQIVSEELGKTTSLTKGGSASWEFTYLDLRVRIELRKP